VRPILSTNEYRRVPRKRIRLANDVALALYFPLLLILINSLRSNQHRAPPAWISDVQSFLYTDSSAHSYHLAFWFLWALGAIFAFLCLRLLAQFSSLEVFIRILGGIVGATGFPLALGYVSFRGYLNMFGSNARALFYAYSPQQWLVLELAATVGCILSCVLLKRSSKTYLVLTVLTLHFGIWARLLVNSGQSRQLLYFLLGVPVSLIWTFYVRQNRTAPGMLSTAAAQSL
jgi:hypothetical protein